jgi:hypothetical protein
LIIKKFKKERNIPQGREWGAKKLRDLLYVDSMRKSTQRKQIGDRKIRR